MKAAAKIDVRVRQAGIERKSLRILHDGGIMSAKMPTSVAQACVNRGRFRRERERCLVVGQGGFELTKPLQSQPEIVMGFRIVRIDRQHFFVLDHRIGNIATAAEDIGQMKSGRSMPFVERDSQFELTTGVFEIVDPNEGRPEHDVVFSRLPCDIDCLPNQVTSFARRTKLAANYGQSTESVEMTGLISENPSIGLFGCMQGESAGNGDCQTNARLIGES